MRDGKEIRETEQDGQVGAGKQMRFHLRLRKSQAIKKEEKRVTAQSSFCEWQLPGNCYPHSFPDPYALERREGIKN